MTRFEVTCRYCDHKMLLKYYDLTDSLRCSKCKSTDLKHKKINDADKDPFGYNTSKPKKDAWIKEDDE